jgi:outer membrane protein OmpA-like peptidoglycan-associated protein
MRTRSVVAACALLALSLPGAASAQRQRAIEVGGFGRYTMFPDTLDLEGVFAGGGRLGVFLIRNLSLEVDASFGVSDRKNEEVDSLRDVSHTLYQARLLYNTERRGRTSFLIGAGYGYDAFGRLRSGPARGGGPTGMLGARFYLTDRVTLRAEAHGLYVLEDEDAFPRGRPSTFEPSIQVGLSAFFRNNRESDMTRMVAARVDTVVQRVTQVDTVYRDRIANANTNTSTMTGGTVVIGVVNFDFDKADISTDARRILTDVAASLARPESQSLRIEVVGNTDAIGGESYNNRLSERRAQAVVDFLRANGVSDTRMTPRAAGEGNPVASNDNPEGRATNRRVLISIIQ